MDHDIEDHERIHNLVVCVGEKGSELYKRDLTKLTDVINKYINSNTQGNTMKGLISKELISR
jgi:hypothetical protein